VLHKSQINAHPIIHGVTNPQKVIQKNHFQMNGFHIPPQISLILLEKRIFYDDLVDE
jgi:hypothetical protein